MDDTSKIWEDIGFFDNITLWDVVKAAFAVIILYSLVFTIWQLNVKNGSQEEQRITEVSEAVTALAAEGYDIYIDGEKRPFIPDIENYFIEFDYETRRINLTKRTATEGDMLLSFIGLGKYGNSGGLFSWGRK